MSDHLSTGLFRGNNEIWDFMEGKLLKRFRTYGGIASITSSSTAIALSRNRDQDLGYSHIRGSETARRIDVKASSASITFSPDSKHLAFTTSPGSTRYEVRPAESEDSITIWDIATDQQENLSGEQEGPIRAITFSLNQKKLVSFSEPWEVVVWKLEIKSPISKFERPDGSVMKPRVFF
ncbi:hypothetical protein TWF132_007744 [Orbilia oligospora]|nr:hypothetical protein TWF132_007744 [Orbilia oligospora]